MEGLDLWIDTSGGLVRVHAVTIEAKRDSRMVQGRPKALKSKYSGK